MMPGRRPGPSWQPLAVLLAVWAGAMLLANPRGDFPLNDDWCFAQPVQTLTEAGSLRYPWCVQATLVTHVLWGSAFVSLSHFSFHVLRLSTLVLTALGGIVVWRLFRDVGRSTGMAAVLAAVFLFNPIVFELSATFMTDVPFAVWSALATLCFLRALRRPTTWTLAVATLCGVAATMLRQPGVFLPLMFSFVFIDTHPLSRRTILSASAPLFVAVLVMLGHQYWLDVIHGQPQYYAHFMGGLPPASRGVLHMAADIAKRLFNIVFHVSWMLLPALLLTATRPSTRGGRRALAGVVIGALVLTLASGKVAPWGSTLIYDMGIGPPLLRDGDSLAAPIPRAPHLVWLLWTLAGAAGTALFAHRIGAYAWKVYQTPASARPFDARLRRRLADPDVAVVALMLGAAVLAIGAMAALQFHDRYVLFLIPPLIVVCAMTADATGSAPVRWMQAAAVAVLVGFAAVAVVGTHDYFSWNRARWAAIDRIVSSGRYASTEIDGGAEFMRWKNALPNPIEHPKIVVAFGEISGYKACAASSFTRWAPHKTDRLLVLVPATDGCPW